MTQTVTTPPMSKAALLTNRLKNAPLLHWHRIGEMGRADFLAGDLEAYTYKQFYHDDAIYRGRPLSFIWTVDEQANPPLLKLEDPQRAKAVLLAYFHPYPWPEFNDTPTADLLSSVVTLVNLVSPNLEIYERGRWFESEDMQRRAETLAYRFSSGEQPQAEYPLEEFTRMETPAPLTLKQRVKAFFRIKG